MRRVYSISVYAENNAERAREDAAQHAIMRLGGLRCLGQAWLSAKAVGDFEEL